MRRALAVLVTLLALSSGSVLQVGYNSASTSSSCPASWVDCGMSWHCVDTVALTLSGAVGYSLMFTGFVAPVSGGYNATVNWVAGDRTSGQLAWLYSSNFLSISNVAAVTGTVPTALASAFTASDVTSSSTTLSAGTSCVAAGLNYPAGY